ncbi:MAG: BON domain-containing protein [Mariprofundus sp.]|nr:BON domain-containing protein [Mariprofundus sp.]
MPLLRLFILVLFTLSLSGCLAGAIVGGATAVGNTAQDERTIGRQFDDTVTASKIDARLIAERDMPSRWVSIEVINGHVTLIGNLPSKSHIDRAIFITKQVNGVVDVKNKLEIGKPKLRAIMSDSWITAQVKRQFWNDKLVSGYKIHVETINGKVYLQGVVHKLVERQRAKEIARKTKGVTAVIDMMRSGNDKNS